MSLYETDYYAWTQDTVEAIKAKKFNEVDYDKIIEELIDLGISQKTSLRSHLKNLISHLLKLQYQPNMNFGRSWNLTINNSRDEIQICLKQSPSLKHHITNMLPMAYRIGLRNAMKETGLDKNTFPEECPYTIEQLLDEEWYPDQKQK